MNTSVGEFFEALIIITVFLTIAYAVKSLFFQKLILPASLLAGIFALLFGPQVLGPVISKIPLIEGRVPEGLISDTSLAIWKQLPEYLITIVFACLFLGRKIPTVKEIVDKSLPNLAYGYTLALGQYMVGLLTAVLILKPFFDINILSGALLAIGFQGGHGTVAGLQSTFNELGFSEGTDLGLGIATIGIITAIMFGTLMSNLPFKKDGDDMHMSDDENNTIELKKTSFTLQVSLVGLSIVLGWLFLKSAGILEDLLLSESNFRIIKYIPLFPVAMLAGLVLQKLAVKWRIDRQISRHHISFISNLSLDILIVAALGSLSLSAIANNIYPLLILAGTGIVYVLLVYFFLSKVFFGKYWRIKGLGELGQSMGTTAIGLILLKKTVANSDKMLTAFSYKQPFYEPIVGGGLITGLALPIIAQFGPWLFLTGIVIMWILVLFLARVKKN